VVGSDEVADYQPESPVKATAETLSYFDGNSDLEDQEILKKHTTITSASTSSATGNSKKKGGRTDQARVETEFIKASEHSDIARSDKSRKRALTEAATESMTSSPKKVGQALGSMIIQADVSDSIRESSLERSYPSQRRAVRRSQLPSSRGRRFS